MYKALTAAQSRALDSYMINNMKIPGIVLMENAALGVIGKIEKLRSCCKVCVFCGIGNNGGDGFAIARGLISREYDVCVLVVGDTSKIKGDAAVNYEYVLNRNDSLYIVRDKNELDAALEVCSDADIVVDAMFGTGLERKIEGIYSLAVHAVNDMPGIVVSVDIPSGVNSDTGQIMGVSVNADYTVAFQTMKRGHFLYPGAAMSGEVSVTIIGDDVNSPVYDGSEISVYTMFDKDLLVSPRKCNANKGDFGKLLLLAGSEGMSGAAFLCAAAAVKSGAGLTTVGAVEYTADKLQMSLPEVMVKILPCFDGEFSEEAVSQMDTVVDGKNAVAIGPGIGTGYGAAAVVAHMVENYDIPKIFDADALNIIAEDPDILHNKKGKILITPHPKEFSRLCGLSVSDILKDPVAAVVEFSEYYDVSVLLKGACTVIAGRDNGVSFISADVPAMAKGGSGDVLTGIIAALTAQNEDIYMSALMGAYIHVTAGYLAEEDLGEYSVGARDIISNLGKAFGSVMSDEFVSEEMFDEDDDAGVYIIDDVHEAICNDARPVLRADIVHDVSSGAFSADWGKKLEEKKLEKKKLEYSEMRPSHDRRKL